MRWRRLVLALSLAVRALSSNESVELRQRAQETLQGKTIRVSFGVTEDPYLFPDTLGDERFAGVLVDFLDQLRKEGSFSVEYVEVSQESFTALNTFNNNTACAHDIFLNRTDLCVGNIWVTTERLKYAKVLPTLWQESLQLAVTKMEDTSFSTALLAAFKPFNPLLWLAIGITIIFYAILAWWAESTSNNRDFPDKSPFASGMTSLYHGLFGFFWSEPPTRPVTAEGRVLAVGFGFFTLIMLSSYTASLASVLVSDNAEPQFDDLQDAINNGATICMADSLVKRVDRLYPGLEATYLAVEDPEAGFEQMLRDRCEGFLVDSIFHAKAQERSDAHCNKELVGPVVIDVSCAWFGADWLVSPLSLYITDLVDRGVLDDLRRVYSPKVQCESSGEEQGLSVDDVSGVFFIIGAFLVTAAVVHACKRSVRHSKNSGSLGRISEKMLKRKTQSSAAAAPPTVPETKRVSAASAPVPVDPPPNAGKRISALMRSSRASECSMVGLNREDPGHFMVLAYREEKRLKEMPFEKALLVIGNAQAQADDEILEALREVKEMKALRSSGGGGEDFEFTEDALPPPTAAKLHASKPLSHPDNNRESSTP